MRLNIVKKKLNYESCFHILNFIIETSSNPKAIRNEILKKTGFTHIALMDADTLDECIRYLRTKNRKSFNIKRKHLKLVVSNPA